MPYVEVQNRGQDVVATNYWATANARAGLVYCTICAGAFRLLLPDQHRASLKDMRASRRVIVSRGTIIEQGVRRPAESLEFMFVDGSPSPFQMIVGAGQCDRFPENDVDEGRTDMVCSVWMFKRGATVKVFDVPASYRNVGSLPCLSPWGPAPRFCKVK